MNEIYKIKKNVVRVPLIANIPHSSTCIPADVRKSIVLNDFELENEVLLLTDRYVNELFSCISDFGGISFEYNYSRLVLDPERFEDDGKEEMAKKGLGVIYTKTSAGKKLRYALTEEDRRSLLDRFYWLYHRAFEQEVQNLLKRFGTCLILDCHSFPLNPLPYEDPKLKRPDICIGTSEIHTPLWLKKNIEGFFNDIKWTTAYNEPFAGTYVPLKFMESKDKRVSSVMMEINRRHYMDEKTGDKLESFEAVKDNVTSLVSNILKDFSRINAFQ